MKRKSVITGLCLFVLLSAGWVLLAAIQQQKKIKTTPAPPLRVELFAIIDSDGDGQVSPPEEQAYARRVMQDIALEVDGRLTPLALKGAEFPSRHEMNEGVGAVRLELAVEADLGAAGEHRLSFRNDHLPEFSVYLVNALVPATDAIKINGQQRDALQHELQVDFRALPPDVSAGARWIGVLMFGLCLALSLTQWKRLRGFFAPLRR